MRISLKYLVILAIVIATLAGIYKFNYSANQPYNDTDGDKIKNPNNIKPRLNDDFYHSVNYEWLQNTTIPKSQVHTGNINVIKDKIDATLRNIVENPAVAKTQTEKQLNNMYASFMNKKQRNKLGIQPIKPYLDAIEKANSHDKIAVLMAKFFKDGVYMPFAVYVGIDMKNSNKHILTLSQSGIYLDREHYVNTTERAKEQLKIYATLLSKLFTLANYKNVEQRVKNAIDAETQLAKIQFSLVQNRDIDKLYNIYNYKKLSILLNNYPLNEMWNILDIPATANINVYQVSYLQNLNKLFKQISVQQWQDYFRKNILIGFATVISEKFNAAAIAYKKQLGMIKKSPPEWKRGISFVSHEIAMITGKVYIEHTFDEQSKKQIHKLVNSIKDEFKFAIKNSTIFSDATKNKALYKLKQMTYNIGYPDEWQDFSKLVIKKEDLFGNVIRVSNFDYYYNLSKLNKKVDNSDWVMSPHVINAFYDLSRNKFTLLAGILNKPFFDTKATDAQNYGGIGVIVAHEIGHAFDDQGAKFDADGNLQNWWLEKDQKVFNKQKNKLIAQINQYQPFPDVHSDGNLKIGEAIGDLNGVQISLNAYLRLVKNKDLTTKKNIKQFFKQYALIWRSKIRHEFALKLVTTDPHSLGEFRANNTLKNIDIFYDTFQIKPSDKMYLKPSERAKLW